MKPIHIGALLAVLVACVAFGDCFNQSTDITQGQTLTDGDQSAGTGEGETGTTGGLNFDCVLDSSGSDCTVRVNGGPYSALIVCEPEGVNRVQDGIRDGSNIDPIANASASHTCTISIVGEAGASVSREFAS